MENIKVARIENLNKEAQTVQIVVVTEKGEKAVTRKFWGGSKHFWYNAIVDGFKVSFNPVGLNVIEITRIYDTLGKKLAVNGGSKSVVEKIKEAVEEQQVQVSKATEEAIVKHEQYETIKTCLECNIPIYLAGPAGSGKNFTVEQIANELGWGFYFSNSVQQEYKITGFIDAGGDFHETEFYKACTSDKECVFFLDEMDASIPEVLVLLNAAIANGYFEFPTGKVTLSNVHFVAAGNTVGSGADDLYSGRMVLDQATLDRFALIDFDYDRNVELSIAKGNVTLVDFIHGLRKFAETNGIRATFSYRCLSMVTKLEATKMELSNILKIAVFKGMDKDTIKTFNVTGYGKYSASLYKLQQAA